MYLQALLILRKEGDRVFWANGNVLHLDRVCCPDILTCQNLSNGTLNIYAFHCM